MHRWFRICASIALVAAFVCPTHAQDKRIDKLLTLVEALTEKVDLQTRQIETLNEDINRLSTALQAHLAAPTPTPRPAATPKPEPTPVDPFTHVVQRGENLTAIAKQHNTTVDELMKLNKIEDENKLQAGQALQLPKPDRKSVV